MIMMVVASVTTELARLPEEASLSLPPSRSPSSFWRFLSRGREELEVVRDGEDWRWSRVSHLITNTQIASKVPSLPPYLSNISAMVSPLNSRGLTQKFWENSLFACAEKFLENEFSGSARPTLWSPSRERRTLSREQEQGTWFFIDTNCSVSGTMSVWAELLNKKLFLSSDVDTNHVIEVVRDSEEMISFQLHTFNLMMTTWSAFQ